MHTFDAIMAVVSVFGVAAWVGCGDNAGSVPASCATATGYVSSGIITVTEYAAAEAPSAGDAGLLPPVGGGAIAAQVDAGYTHGCGQSSFSFSLGDGCHLTAKIENVVDAPSSYARGAMFESAWSSVAAGQTCTIATAEGLVSISVVVGSISVTPASTSIMLLGTNVGGQGQTLITF